ncbi:iron ABC transporter [Salipaludibacillus neizhouensis]|uniref:Iron ABC transporter n=1 Tax=Salipaludibacillus neizhouensis TaxID=885475 RepID=A0A3A9K768_9BACI|nr:iron ABC transporter permease [Salipaludibacillus neizhouensis]RKL67318.1 iron ABC transporter [Salipaludibacillus neizhouensis]
MKLVPKILIHTNGWSILTFLFVCFILLPNLSILLQLFSEPNENWEHIKAYMLQDYLVTTFVMIVLLGILTIVIGVSLAWLVSAYDFPMKGFLKWGLILPLSIPPYIGAYAYHGLLNYTGIIQTTLRNSFGIQVNQKYFDIMNIPGAVFIFTVFLFPYVYMITRAFLVKQSASIIENARLLGSGSVEIFFRIVLPISRVAIVGGGSLVILEFLNDYGVVKYFGIQTLSTAIFQTWFGLGDLESAIKLAGTLMAIVVFLLLMEKIMRGRKKYSSTTTKVRPLKPIKLTGWKAGLTTFYCGSVFMLAFIIPFSQLVMWVFMAYDAVLNKDFIKLIWNSVFVASIGAIAIVIIALIIGNFTRLSNGFFSRISAKVVILGYSIPGAVIAIGVLILFIGMDKTLSAFYSLIGMNQTLVLSTSLILLCFAYVIRFLAIGYNSIEAGYEKNGNHFTEASRMLGMTMTQTFFKVDLKLIKGAVISAFILAWVEIIKELPLTLILRPFNFETLATKAFQYAGNEMVQEAAIPSLIIVMISGIFIFFSHLFMEKEVF